ncbi:hypothetical protein POTOM_059427 [Populus tomentosa]|uniref:Ankyrin repeat family protein n=1 Tax=Populus tomentosa TaxID=118781 RepID=A0A8X7XT03_POPTO|nr:hypothetical protein POTOM_059427 [Populus tomentosa]
MLKKVSALVQTLKRKVFEEEDYDSDEDSHNHVQNHDGCGLMHFCGEYDCPITTILLADDVDKFLKMLKGPVDHQGQISWTLHIRCLMTFFNFNSVKCIIAVANHIDFNAVHPDFGFAPLHLAVWRSCLPLVELFLKHNAPTDFRSPFDIFNQYQMLPLNYSLHLLSYLIHFKILTPEQSIYKMLMVLCLPQLRSKLEIVRLLARETNELGEEIFCYAQHGRLVELAVLLLVAREKVTSVSLVKKSSLSQNDHDCSCLDHCVTLREFIIFELGRLSALQVKLEICCEDDKLSSSCKEKQNLMMSALLLLEIFERAGKTIKSYLQNQVGWMIFLEFPCIVYCQNICLRDWTSEKSVTSLLYALGLMDSRKLLETIKSHLDKTEEIGELVCYYTREGGVVKVAALLMVAWKRLMVVDSFDSKHGASCGRSKIHQFLMSEIEKLIDKEMQPLGKSTKIHMDEQNMTSNKMSTDKQNMMSALQLLEIFERAGDGLDQFVQWRQCSEMTKEDSAEIACLLSGLVCTSNPKGTLKWCSEYELDEGESPSVSGRDNDFCFVKCHPLHMVEGGGPSIHFRFQDAALLSSHPST